MSRHRSGSFGLLLLLVLLAHGLGLSWLSEQVQQLKPLVPMPDPMFTRIIEPVPPPFPARRPIAPSANHAELSAATPADVEAPPGTAADPVAPALADAQAQDEREPSEPAAQADEPKPAVVAEEAPASDGWPADTRVSYQLKGRYRGDIYGDARVQWQREQSRYQVRLDLRMALVLGVSMISQGEVGATSLLPGVYEEQFPWGMRRVAFEGGLVRFNNGTQLPQPPALQDTVSQFVELSHRFSSGREVLQTGRPVSVWLARPQGMALWTYDVVEEEILHTPELGAVPAFHLRPRPIANPTGVISAEIWFAPSLQYLPVRVRIALDEGDFVDLLVLRIEQGAAPAAPRAEWRDGP